MLQKFYRSESVAPLSNKVSKMSTESHIDIINKVLQVTAALESIKTINKDLNVELLVNTTMRAPEGTEEDFEPVKESIISYLKAIQADSQPNTTPKATAFMYIKCLCDNSLEMYENDILYVKEVTFSISRFRENWEHLKMPEKCTVKEAIEAAEEYLSMPLTREYFDKNNKYDYDFNKVAIRGDLLGGSTFLEVLRLKNGVLSLHCGS
jgi:hypothetical protein